MSESTVITIADAIVDELVGDGSLLPSDAVVRRGYRPTFDLKDLNVLHVTVVPRSLAMERATRALTQNDVQIDLGVMQKLGDGENDTADALMLLVEQIMDFLNGRILSGAPKAAYIRAENEPIYMPEHIDQYRQFTSIITLTYRVLR